MKAFGWSLYEIDETDIESLLPFIRRMLENKKPVDKRVYCDEVDWL